MRACCSAASIGGQTTAEVFAIEACIGALVPPHACTPARPNRPERSHARSSSSVLESPPPSSMPVLMPIPSSIRDVVPPGVITVRTTTTSTVVRRASFFGLVNPAASATLTAPCAPAQRSIIWNECWRSPCLCPCQRWMALIICEKRNRSVTGRQDGQDGYDDNMGLNT